MLRENEEIELTIHDLSRSGPGVGRVSPDSPEEKGLIIFVPLTAPGDVVRVKVEKIHKRYAEGELLEIVKPSPLRITARCPAFGICGGCRWQHIPYPLQWKTKSLGVQYSLERMGIKPEIPHEEFPAERIWEYRNRVQLRGFKSELGFHKRGSNEVAPVSRCDIARPEINQAWESVQKEGEKLVKPYKVELEVLPDGTLAQSWNQGHAALGFRQIHDEQNEILKKWVANGVKKGDRVLDLYGGSGNLGGSFVEKAASVDTVDLFTHRLPEAPAHWGFHREAVLDWLKKAVKSGRKFDVAVIDPPREGLGGEFSGIEPALAKLGVSRIIGVECDPDSWARDLKRFLDRGWKLKRWGSLDLFPQTEHIESLFEVHSELGLS